MANGSVVLRSKADHCGAGNKTAYLMVAETQRNEKGLRSRNLTSL